MSDAIIVEVACRQSAMVIDEELLTQAVRAVILDSGLPRAEISVAVVDDPTIHQLNVEYLNHDYPTDVLSFPLTGGDDFLAGEVIVSSDTATREAPRHQLTPEQELVLYVIHGTLHLVGYDDKQPASRVTMRQQEMRFMRQLGFPHDPVAREAGHAGK